MGFIDENLMPKESVIYRTKLHWIGFVFPVLLILFGVLMRQDPEVAGFGTFLVTLGIVSGVVRGIAYATSEFGVTNRRILIKTGVIRRNSIETLLAKIEGISVNQGIFGRFLGYGTITVTGTGGSRSPFKQVANALELRRRIQEQIETSQQPA